MITAQTNINVTQTCQLFIAAQTRSRTDYYYSDSGSNQEEEEEDNEVIKECDYANEEIDK